MEDHGTFDIVIRLNGTSENPYARWGMSHNPFPQIAKYEHTASIIALQKLGGEPIPHDRYEQYIRKMLRGLWTDEFIDRVVKAFRPGEYLTLSVKVSW